MPFNFTIPFLAGSGGSAGSMGSMIIMILLVVVVFYFFILRPENKKKKETTQMRDNLKVGDQITTIGGVVGTICAVKEETIVMETGADRVRIEFTRWAVSSKGTQPEENTVAPMEKEMKENSGRKKKKAVEAEAGEQKK